MNQHINNYIDVFSSMDKRVRPHLTIYFVRSISAGMLFYIAIYLSHISLKTSVIGFEISSLVLGGVIGSACSAIIMGKYNPFYICSICLIFQGICFITITLDLSSYILALIVFCIGFLGYIYKICSEYIITGLSGDTERDRSKAITCISVLSNLGISLGGVIVSIFSSLYPHLMFNSLGVILICLALPYFFDKTKIKMVQSNLTKDNQERDKGLFYLSIFVSLLMGMIFAQNRVGFSIFLENTFSGYGISSVILVNTFIIVVFLPALRSLLMNYELIYVIGTGGLLLGVGMYMLTFIHSISLVMIACAVWTIGEMMVSTFSQLLCFESAHKRYIASGYGAYKFNYSVGTLMGSLLAGELLGYFSISALWLLCGIIGLVIMLSCFLSSKKIPNSLIKQQTL